MKKVMITLLLLLLVVMFSACNSNSQQAADSSSASVSADAPGDNGDVENDFVEWPGDLMGNLPAPKCKITSVDKGGQLAPDLIVVAFGEMEKADAEEYLKQLNALEYTGGVSISSEDKIMFSGVDSKNAGANLDYNVKDKTGYISYDPNIKAASSN